MQQYFSIKHYNGLVSVTKTDSDRNERMLSSVLQVLYPTKFRCSNSSKSRYQNYVVINYLGWIEFAKMHLLLKNL